MSHMAVIKILFATVALENTVEAELTIKMKIDIRLKSILFHIVFFFYS